MTSSEKFEEPKLYSDRLRRCSFAGTVTHPILANQLKVFTVLEVVIKLKTAGSEHLAF